MGRTLQASRATTLAFIMDAIFGVDWVGAFKPSVPLLETFVRGTVMYLGILFLLRIILRRQAAAVSATDLLTIVLLADAAQNGMSAGAHSITDGLLLVVVIVFWNYLLDRIGFSVPRVGRFVHPPPLALIKDGVLLWQNMRHEYITAEELFTQLRERGIEDLSEVKLAYIEGDGKISVIKKK